MSLNSPEVYDELAREHMVRNGDWDMDRLMVAADVVNPGIRRAHAEWEAARAGEAVAATRPPIGVSLDLQHASKAASPWTYGLLLDVPIETGGKRNARMMRASAEANGAAIGMAKTRWDLQRVVAQQYITRLEQEARLDGLKKNSEVLATWEAAVKSSAELGEGGRMEELTVARERATLERDMADAERQARNASAALARALGVPENEVAGLSLRPLPRELPTAPSLSSLQSRAAVARPDVLEKLAAYAACEAALKLEIANQYPDVHLSPGYSFDQGQRKWLLSPTASILPDLNGAGIAKARADREVAAAAFDEVQNAALGDVSAAWRDLNGSLELARKARAVMRNSEEMAVARQDLLDGGDGDRLALLQTRYLAAQDQLAAVEAGYQAWRALAVLQDAVRAEVPGLEF